MIKPVFNCVLPVRCSYSYGVYSSSPLDRRCNQSSVISSVPSRDALSAKLAVFQY